MLELLYPIVLAALLLLLSKIVRRIVAKVKAPVEYSNPSMWLGSARGAIEVDGGNGSDRRAVDIDDSDKNNNGGYGFGGGGNGGPGGGGGDSEIMLTPRNLLQQQGGNSIG